MSSNFPPIDDASNGAPYPQHSLGNGQIPPYYPPEYVHTNNNNMPGGQAISGSYLSASQAIPMTPGIQGNFYGQQTIAGQFQGPPPPLVSKGPFQWYKRQSRGKKLGIGCGSLLLVLMMCTCSLAANAGSKQAGNTSITPTVKSVILAQSTPDEVLKKGATVVVNTHLIKPTVTAKTVATATSNQIVQPTQVVQPTAMPTSAPVVQPTATPIPVQPTATPVPVQPTPVPVQPTPVPAQPTPTPIPVQPTPTPVQSTGVNGNPWGYNFNLGNYITQPPATFCTYFACIKNFLNGNGYVVECQDTMYSLSGGIRGACSYHGGVLQALYSH